MVGSLGFVAAIRVSIIHTDPPFLPAPLSKQGQNVSDKDWPSDPNQAVVLLKW
jgi:hypothetical protein